LFDSTLSFPLLGPVFNLPAGYTVQSASGLIVDNRWLSPDAVPVPEPLGVGKDLIVLDILPRLSYYFNW